ncbi:HlyD family efflux transporter periplasmic adaptor subunit [Paenibacillus chitinolyticus]|uniref:HlyD family secretion protein n=1 Tax=Paenibacillus chitinolyticus TaxID=79263 RepID=UPI002DBB3779|nr:HlyD family efflux transporter periplasmic adaptor subunit [Paenibacillus chitinolyticus]MEC0247363.1 HlyD family efflux transporter periplasmic adaptor subunit [Paenibacillus chitinolyticus]
MKFVRPVVYVVMAGLIGGGTFLLSSKEALSSTQNRPANLPTAYIEANQVAASFKAGGRVTEILVKEGDTVKKGQVLARIQSQEIEAKVAQAKAAVSLSQGKIAEAKGAEATAQAKKQQGQEAVTLTAETAEKQVKQAEAVVKAAQTKVDALKNGARPEEKKQAEIQLNATKEVFQTAEESYNRVKKMKEEGLVAQTDVDKAKVSYEEAKAKYEVAQQQYALAQQGPRVEEIQAAEAQLEQAKAAVELAKANMDQVKIRQGDVNAAQASIQQAQGAVKSAQSGQQQAQAAQSEAETYLSYTELLAPSDGIIISQSAQLGEMVGSGFPVFTMETSAETKWARFYLKETDAAGLKAGDTVTVKVTANGAAVTGKVSTVAPAADFAVKKATQNASDTDIRSFGVKVELPQLPESVLTGMTVQWEGKAGDTVAP